VAWSIADYNDFLDVVQDVYGADRGEAQDMYAGLRDVLGGSLTVADLEEYADVVSDLTVGVVEEPEPPGEFEREPGEEPLEEKLEEEKLEWDYEFDWQDEWYDEGEEIEITADVHYED